MGWRRLAPIQRRNRSETESQARLMDGGGSHQVTFLSFPVTALFKCFLNFYSNQLVSKHVTHRVLILTPRIRDSCCCVTEKPG